MEYKSENTEEIDAIKKIIEQLVTEHLVISDTQLFKELSSGESMDSLENIKRAAYELQYEDKLLVLNTKEGGFILRNNDGTEH